MDAVRGASEGRTETYSRYVEGALERSNEEMRHLRRSYSLEDRRYDISERVDVVRSGFLEIGNLDLVEHLCFTLTGG